MTFVVAVLTATKLINAYVLVHAKVATMPPTRVQRDSFKSFFAFFFFNLLGYLALDTNRGRFPGNFLDRWENSKQSDL